MSQKDKFQVLMRIEPPKSIYKTWADYSMRMKQSTVSIEDYELFYRKYYGFIIGFCRKIHRLDNDWQIAEIIELVFDKFIRSREQFNRSKGHFRSWFAKLIHNIVKDYFNAQTNREKPFLDEDGKHITIDIEKECEDNSFGIMADNGPDDQELWDGYLAFLAWEEVAKTAPPVQVQCFLWRHNNNRKPAEIAAALNITSLQVSEHIRAFKNKLAHAMQNLDANYDPEKANWDDIKRQADAAKTKYLAIANEFPVMGENNNEARR